MAEENTKKINTIWVKQFIALLALLAPVAYLIGLSFHQGTLSAYGIESDSFPLSVQDMYVEAFFAISYLLLTITKFVITLVKLVTTLPGLGWFIAIALTIAAILYVILKRPKIRKLRYSIEFPLIKRLINYLHWENNDFTKALSITGFISYSLFVLLYGLVALSVLWFAFPLAAYYQGRDVATQKIDLYLKEGCHLKKGERWGNCKALKTADNKIVYEGILVAHANGYVAFFTKAGSFVTKFPDDGVIVSELPQ